MECKLSAENTILQTKIIHLEKKVEEVYNQLRHTDKINQDWCADFEQRLKELGYISEVNLDTAIIDMLNDIIVMKQKLGIETDHFKQGRCPATHCRRYVSLDWNFCPVCGRALGNKVKTTTNEIFNEIETSLPINDQSKDPNFNWRTRWAWAKRRLIEGRD